MAQKHFLYYTVERDIVSTVTEVRKVELSTELFSPDDYEPEDGVPTYEAWIAKLTEYPGLGEEWNIINPSTDELTGYALTTESGAILASRFETEPITIDRLERVVDNLWVRIEGGY